DAAGDLARGRCLFLERVTDLLDGAGDAPGAGFDVDDRTCRVLGEHDAVAYLANAGLHAGDRVARAVLDAFDHAHDVAGRAGGAFGELAHLVGDHGEAATLLAGACGFDGGIERQQVG